MATYVTPYCQIHGYDFSSLVHAEGVSPSGGGAGVEEIQIPSRNYADIRPKGRALKKYKIQTIPTKDRELIEAFLMEVNTAPEDAEFYPYDAARHGLIVSAHATLKSGSALDKQLYVAEAEITCREPWLCGPDKGMPFDRSVSLPTAKGALVNEGQERAPIAYMQASGQYFSGSYVENLHVRIYDSWSDRDRELELCDKLLQGDNFELGWRGECRHTWKMDVANNWDSVATVSQDVHGLVSGGSLSSGVVTLDDGDYIMIPFYGPLPVSGDEDAACLEFTLSAIGGTGGAVYAGNLVDLSDLTEVSDDLVVGSNKIYIPDMGGEGLTVIGLKADSGGANSLAITALKGQVKRYVAPADIPAADPGEVFGIEVWSSAGTRLRFLRVAFNDRYHY